ncbi:MAG: family 1 glycosylhydrolase [Candidatus Saccharibacteria bacterium]|nr:family 1 glycosylhydrolase [Candidatus Saccharibacteria bacterium]
MKQNNRFPKNFLWGASTAGHQVEGGNVDQWSVWELAHAKELASTAEQRLNWLPNWDKTKHYAKTPENYVSSKGVDHFRRYEEDFDLAKKLNLNAFRFSIEWSRCEPEEGVWDKAAFDHYHSYILELKKRGIEPIVNLWHWTHPVWFEQRGAFSKSSNTKYFLRFVAKVAEEFGGEIKYVITLNEPNIYVSYSEWNGGLSVPPEYPRWQRLFMFLRLIKAHKKAYQILKASNPDLHVGAAVQMSDNKAKTDSFLSRAAVYFADRAGNYFFNDRTRKQNDFIGFNYYFTNYFKGFKLDNPASPKNDLGLYMEPGGVGKVATKLWLRYKKPVMVTENGVADATDQYRQWWLEETMMSLDHSLSEGTKLVGYMHWSLLDNFEWAYGWWPKFGLVAVDREHSMKRTPRPSALWWSEELKKISSKT